MNLKHITWTLKILDFTVYLSFKFIDIEELTFWCAFYVNPFNSEKLNDNYFVMKFIWFIEYFKLVDGNKYFKNETATTILLPGKENKNDS